MQKLSKRIAVVTLGLMTAISSSLAVNAVSFNKR